MKALLAAALLLLATLNATDARADTIRLAVTTSFQNSGLSDVLLPAIARDTGLDVQLLVVGTGQALALGAAGDVDAVLVHSPEAERAQVKSGALLHRREIMVNDFVVIGPGSDPSDVAGATSLNDALARISTGSVPFVSRGDDSGTHRRELALWKAAGIDPAETGAAWYREAGSGMGATLNTAVALGAYTLSDRASWLNFSNRADHTIVFADDPALLNQYAFLPVNPARHPHVKAQAAHQLEDWLTGPVGQALIDGYRVGGQRLFTANAKPEPEL